MKSINKENQFFDKQIKIQPIFMNEQESAVSFMIISNKMKGGIDKEKLAQYKINNR